MGNSLQVIKNDSENYNDSIKVKDMVVLAIATSIDAMAIGMTFACLNIKIKHK